MAQVFQVPRQLAWNINIICQALTDIISEVFHHLLISSIFCSLSCISKDDHRITLLTTYMNTIIYIINNFFLTVTLSADESNRQTLWCL